MDFLYVVLSQKTRNKVHIRKSITIWQYSVVITSRLRHNSIHAPSCLVAIPTMGLCHTCPANLTTFELMTKYGPYIRFICPCETYTSLPPSHKTHSWLCRTCMSTWDYYKMDLNQWGLHMGISELYLVASGKMSDVVPVSAQCQICTTVTNADIGCTD